MITIGDRHFRESVSNQDDQDLIIEFFKYKGNMVRLATWDKLPIGGNDLGSYMLTRWPYNADITSYYHQN